MVDILTDVLHKEGEYSNPLTGKCRLGDCEVCGGKEAKYTCPACEVKTCSLPCVSIHKKELDCTGLRNRVKFKRISSFTDMDLHSDYSLLEEMGRSVDRVIKGRKPYQKNMAFKWQKLRSHLWRHGTRLQLLPPKFSKHVLNTTHLNWQTGVVQWKLQWLFPQSSSDAEQPLTDDRVDETSIISDLVEKYLGAETLPNRFVERLQPYRDAGGLPSVKVLMRAERVAGSCKYFLLTPGLSLAENLQGKTVIEHPTLLVVLNSHLHEYSIVSPDNVEVRENVRGHRRKWETSNAGCNSSMKFFSDNMSDSNNDSDSSS